MRIDPVGSTPPAHIDCRLCGATAQRLFVAEVLSRYPVGYFHCSNCDLIQTQQPFWLEEAYGSALSVFDTGAVARDRMATELTLATARLLKVGRDASCLDYGGGHGVLTRGMRDAGYDFRWHDKYANNVYARGFEGDPGVRQALLTCFEVWEHLPDAGVDLEQLFRPGHDAVLVSTVLHRGHRENWWYYCPEAGQHVAFFSARTMQFVARRFGYSAIVGDRYTLFHRPNVLRGWRHRLASLIIRRAGADRNSRAVAISSVVGSRLPSRVWEDHTQLVAQSKSRRMKAA